MVKKTTYKVAHRRAHIIKRGENFKRSKTYTQKPDPTKYARWAQVYTDGTRFWYITRSKGKSTRNYVNPVSAGFPTEALYRQV